MATTTLSTKYDYGVPRPLHSESTAIVTAAGTGVSGTFIMPHDLGMLMVSNPSHATCTFYLQQLVKTGVWAKVPDINGSYQRSAFLGAQVNTYLPFYNATCRLVATGSAVAATFYVQAR